MLEIAILILVIIIVMLYLIYRLAKSIIEFIFFGFFVVVSIVYFIRAFCSLKKSFPLFVMKILMAFMWFTLLIFIDEDTLLASMGTENGLTEWYSLYVTIITLAILFIFVMIIRLIEKKKSSKIIQWLVLPLYLFFSMCAYLVPYRIAEKKYYMNVVTPELQKCEYQIKQNTNIYTYIVGNIEERVEVYWYLDDQIRVCVGKLEKGTNVYLTGNDAMYEGTRYIEVFTRDRIGYIDESLVE